jgi:hypothetical protein
MCCHAPCIVYGLFVTRAQLLELFGHQFEEGSDSKEDQAWSECEFLSRQPSVTVEGYDLTCIEVDCVSCHPDFCSVSHCDIHYAFGCPIRYERFGGEKLMALAQASGAIDSYLEEKFGKKGELVPFLTGCYCCS